MLPERFKVTRLAGALEFTPLSITLLDAPLQFLLCPLELTL